VLVRLHATALNRADLLQRQGKYPAPQGVVQNIPGLEFAGEVAELGPGATYWEKGDRVFGLTPGGAHAEYVVVEEGRLAAIPGGMDWITAAAIPEVFITAYDALISQARLQLGERVLIHAVGSGRVYSGFGMEAQSLRQPRLSHSHLHRPLLQRSGQSGQSQPEA